jgi:hypothetical protein
MQFELPRDELEWIDQQVAGVRASITKLQSEIAACEKQLSRLYSARERAASKRTDPIAVPLNREKSTGRLP